MNTNIEDDNNNKGYGEDRGVIPTDSCWLLLQCVQTSPRGILMRVLSKGVFLGLSGFCRLLVYPLGLFIFKTLYFKFPFGFLVHGSWLFLSGLEGWVFGSPGGSVSYRFLILLGF